MNIVIQTDEKDAAALSGFAVATGWSDKTGKKQEEWLREKVSDWILSNARVGSRMSQTALARASYITALRAADATAKEIIQPPVVTAGIV